MQVARALPPSRSIPAASAHATHRTCLQPRTAIDAAQVRADDEHVRQRTFGDSGRAWNSRRRASRVKSSASSFWRRVTYCSCRASECRRKGCARVTAGPADDCRIAAARVRVLAKISGSAAPCARRSRAAGADEGRAARGAAAGLAWRLCPSAKGCGRVQRGAAPCRGGDVMYAPLRCGCRIGSGTVILGGCSVNLHSGLAWYECQERARVRQISAQNPPRKMLAAWLPLCAPPQRIRTGAIPPVE